MSSSSSSDETNIDNTGSDDHDGAVTPRTPSSPSHTSVEISEIKNLGGVSAAEAVFQQGSVSVLCFRDYCFLLSEEFRRSFWLSCNWNNFLLLIVSILTFAIGIKVKGLKNGWYTGGAILLAIIMITFSPSIFNFYRKILEEKKKRKNKLEVTVERGGLHRTVSVSDVKEGDRGEGAMIAVSNIGKELIHNATNSETLLQSLVNKSNDTLGRINLVSFIPILVVALARLFHKDYEKDYNIKPANKGNVTMVTMENVLQRIFLQFRWTGFSFLVGAFLTVILGLQHGMPLSIYISLSRWAKRITSHGVKSQNLSACGTMGLVSVICLDITGGGGWLSSNHIEIHQFWTGAIKFISGMELHPDVVKGLVQALGDLRFCPNNSVHFREILFQFWANLGLDIHDGSLFRSNQSPIRELVSKSENSEANLYFHYYGDDAFTILSRCSHYYDNSGTIHDMKNKRVLFQKVIHNMIVKGLRPIAFARVDTNHHHHFEGGLKLLGFVGLRYSFDQEIKTALNDLKDVGIRIVLTSEDELSVATTMAMNLGIDLNRVIEGVRFREKMKGDEKEKNELKNSITLMAKATLEDKLLLLQELKASRHVVAFLPGGLTTTDAQTLMEADVGITLEKWSSEATRTISDLIVAAPTSLIKIIRCGRCIYLNIQNYYLAQFTSNISGLQLILVYSIVSGNSPLAFDYLLLLPFIMCPLGTLLMLIEFDDEKVKSGTVVVGERDRCLITKLMMMKIATHVLIQVLLFSLLEYVGLKAIWPSMEENVRHTFIFNTFILWQICNLLGAMGLVTMSAAEFKAVLKSPLFLISLASVLIVQVVVIEFAAKFVNGVKLSAGQWAICFLLAIQRLAMEWLLSVLSTWFTKLFTHVNFTLPRWFSSIIDCL